MDLVLLLLIILLAANAFERCSFAISLTFRFRADADDTLRFLGEQHIDVE
jgi:hypothetical protein